MKKTLDQSCFKHLSNLFTWQQLLPFLIITEKIHPKYSYLLRINTKNIYHLEFLPKMKTQAITANIPIGHHFDEVRSFQSMITEKAKAHRSKQNTSAGFQPQRQSVWIQIYSILKPLKVYLLLKIPEFQFQPVLLWYQGITMPLQVPT